MGSETYCVRWEQYSQIIHSYIIVAFCFTSYRRVPSLPSTRSVFLRDPFSSISNRYTSIPGISNFPLSPPPFQKSTTLPLRSQINKRPPSAHFTCHVIVLTKKTIKTALAIYKRPTDSFKNAQSNKTPAQISKPLQALWFCSCDAIKCNVGPNILISFHSTPVYTSSITFSFWLVRNFARCLFNNWSRHSSSFEVGGQDCVDSPCLDTQWFFGHLRGGP